MAEEAKKKTPTFDAEKAAETSAKRTREVGDEYSRVLNAYTEAGIEYWTGVVKVAGDYWNNVTDTLRNGFDQKREAEDADAFTAGTGVLADLSHHTAQVYAESAKVIASSMKSFGENYDEKAPAHKATKTRAAAK